MNFRKAYAVLAAAVGWVAMLGPAGAQEAPGSERQSVLTRARPDYDPLGVRGGSFVFLPSLGVTESYDSNVFVTESQQQADFLTTISPSLLALSNWNNNALNFHLSSDMNRYAQQVGENYTNVAASVDGRYDIERGVYATGGLSYNLGHEARSSPNTVFNQKSPTEYQLGIANAGFVHDTGILSLALTGSVNDYAYNNEVTSTGLVIPETPRNRFEYDFQPRVAYEIVPGYSAFVQTPFKWTDYNAQFTGNGTNLSSREYELDVGTAVNIGGIINGEIFAGYYTADYYLDRSAGWQSGYTFGGSLLWNVTQQTSIRSSLTRALQATIVVGAVSYLQTALTASVEHELLRNVLVTGGVGYTEQDYIALTPSRSDYNYNADAGVQYLINRNWRTGLTATYNHRYSDASALEYSEYILSANLRLQF